MTTKPLVYLVNTDYDLSLDMLDKGHDEIQRLMREKAVWVKRDRNMDFLDNHPVFNVNGGSYLEAGLKKYRQGEITPNLELRPECMAIHQKWGLVTSIGFPDAQIVTYEIVRDLIYLKGPDGIAVSAHYLPSGQTHIDLVFDFVSSNGCYTEILRRLDEDFEVRRLDIFRDHGAEMRDRYEQEAQAEQRVIKREEERKAEEGGPWEIKYGHLAEKFE